MNALTTGERMNAFLRTTCLLILALTLLLPSAGCSVGAVAAPAAASELLTSSPAAQSTVTVAGPVFVAWDDDDLHANWSTVGSTDITLNGESISVDGKGAVVDGSSVTITYGGTYVVSGTLDDGQIRVDTVDVNTVQLVLNGADISCSTSAPVYVVNAEKVVITLADGAENRVTDGTQYVFEDTATDEPNAAIFSHDDLTINGDGSLTVTANFDNGIQSKDDLKIAGGTITVTAVNDGLKGRDSIAVRDANITVTAGGDGMQSSNDEDADEGFILIEGGALSITAGMDGIQAETSLFVSGGTIAIISGGGSAASSSGTTTWSGNAPGNPHQQGSSSDEATDSAKGLKAGIDLVIAGGVISVDSSDDAIHSNGSVTVSGGDITLASGDDGIHADASVGITGGETRITGSYEGIESAVITVSAGNVHVVSSDDGINVRGGNDGSGMMGMRPGQDSFSTSSGNYLALSGGYVAIDAIGDGLDINGSITMTGGVVIVNGPTSSGNGALDYYGACEVTDGLLVAAGSIGMAQGPSASSTQRSVMVNLTSALPAGTLFRLETADGEEVLTFAPTKAYQSVVFSAPGLEDGAAYVVFTGGSSTGTVVDGLYSGGQYSGGTQYAEFTVSSMVTTVGSAARGFSGGPGGGRRTPQ